MSFLKKLRRRRTKKSLRKAADEMMEEVAKKLAVDEPGKVPALDKLRVALKDMSLVKGIDTLLKPRDLLSHPQIAVELAIRKAVEQNMQPYRLAKQMLEEMGIELDARWELIFESGVAQYNLGNLTKRIYDLSLNDLEGNIPINTISYAVCVDRSLDEILDELKQINGLLDGMSKEVAGCGHYEGKLDGMPPHKE